MRRHFYLFILLLLSYAGFSQQPCSGAIPATVTTYNDNSQPITIDTSGFSDMPTVPSCEGFDSTEQGRWYEITTNNSTGFALNMVSGNGSELEGAIYDACGGNEIICFADGGTQDLSDEILVTGLSQNTTYYLQLYSESFNTGIFELAVTDLPLCPVPNNVSNDAVSVSTADFSWDAVSNASNGYEYVVMADGDAPDPNNAVATDPSLFVTSASVSGLSANTPYDFYVRADCGGGDESDWTDKVDFVTLCTAFTTPYSENFDNDGNNPIPDNGDLPDCWVSLIDDASGTASLEIDDGSNSGAPTPFTSPNHVELTTDDTGDSVALISPEFSDLGDQDNRIRFYAQRDDHAGDLLIGTITDPNDISTFTLFETITNSQLEEGTWNEFVVSFDTYTGGSAHIAFLQEEPNAFSDTYVDNFVYEEIPSCPIPGNVSNDAVSASTADFSWDAVGNANSGYEYVVMADGDAANTTTAVATGTVATGTTTAQATLLSSNTNYDFYVRANCGGSDFSPWSAKVDFKTDCVAFTTPYSENFDGVSASDPFAGVDCWATAGNNANEVELEDFGFWSSTPSSPNLVEFGDVDFDNGDEAILVSPQFSDLPDHDNRITFKAAFEDASENTSELIIGVMSDPTDAATFVEIERVTSSTDDVFTTFKVNLDDAASIGSSQYVAIASGADDGDFDEIAFDDFVYEEIPSCDTPTTLESSNVTNNSVDLSWNAPSAAPANGYDWEVVPAGDGQGNNVVSSGNTSSTSVTATGLSGDTFYDAYVRSNCGSGDGESPYIGPVNFRTAPAPAQGLACNSGGSSSVIFSEEFDTNDAGWTGDVNSGDDSWEIPDDASSSNTGADSAFSGSNYMNFEASNTSSSQGSIVSPAIDLSGGNAEAELSFWMHAYGVDMGTLEVGVGTSATGPFTNEFTWSGQLQTSGADAWVNVGVNLDAYVGQTIYIQLTQIDDGSNFEGDMSIDLFEVSTCLSCATPTNLAVSNISTSAADLSWDSEATATSGYDWVVMNSGDDPDVDTPAAESANSVTGTTASVSGLSSNTPYDAYVRSNCGGNDKSDWSSAESFTTPCVVETFPYSDDFESGTVDDCWTLSNASQISIGSSCSTNTTSFLRIDGGTHTTETNAIDVSGETSVEVKFDISNGCNNESESGETLNIDYWDGSAWQLLESIDPVDIPQDWTTSKSYIISSGLTADFKVRFDRDGGTQDFDDLSIDNLSVNSPPSCISPTGLTASNVTATSVDLDWNSEPTATSGYDWVIMNSGDDPDVDTPAAEPANSVTGTTASVSGLSSNTPYNAYVRSNCGGGDKSDWSNAESFTTLCATITSFPYTESFDTFLNDCWEEATGTASNTTSTGSSSWSGDSFNGDDSAYINMYTNTTAQWLVTEDFDLGSTTDYQIALGILATEWDSPTATTFGVDDEVGLMISTDDGATWTNLGTYTNGSTPSNTGQTDIYDLSSYTGVVKLGIYAIASSGTTSDHDVYITDFTIEEIPSCPDPSNLTLSAVTDSTADFSFTASSGETGGNVWRVMNDGDDVITGSPAADGTTTTGASTVSVSGLSGGTSYDFYIQAFCGASGTSSFAGPLSFSTLPVNDDACDAIDLTLGASSTGTQYSNIGATAQTNEPDADLDDGVDGSVWFSFVAPTYGNVQVTTDIAGGTLTDTEIAAYSTTDCSDFTTFTQIGFDQDGGSTVNFNSVLNLYDLTAGDTYYIQVDRWGSASDGTFGIEVSDLSYVYNGTAWSPQVPGGNTTDINNLIVESGTAPIAAATTANEVSVMAGAVLDLNADLTADVTFHSDASGTAQLADATGNSITGDVTVERFIPVQTEDTRAFRFLTSAVDSNNPIRANWQEGVNNTGTNFPADNEDPNPGFGTHITGDVNGNDGFDASISGLPSMYTFDNSFTGNQDNAWNPIPNTNSRLLNAGEAYRIFIRGDRGYDLTSSDPVDGPNSDVTLRATGDLVIGDQTETLSDIGGYYSMLGNPYQAIVDVTQVLNATNSNNVNTNFYWVWDPNMSPGGAQGAYVAVELPTGNSQTPGGSPSSSAANKYVMPGQSFFVRTSTSIPSTGNADLTFTESSKAVGETPTEVFSDNNTMSINLLLYTDQALANGDSEADALGINFSPNGNNDVDAFDAGKLGNPDENLARLNDGEYLSIENRAMPADGEELSLFTSGYTGSNYTYVVNVSNLPNDVVAYLVDEHSGSQTLVTEGANQISFSVDPSVPGSVATDRFSIEFEIETFGVDDNEALSGFEVYPNPVSDGNVTLQAPNMSGEVNINLYNMIGQRVMEMKGELSDNGKASLNIGKQQSGVYFIEVEQNGQKEKERLIIK